MNFFEHQERAQRKTGLLSIYFAVAVALIILAVDAVIVAAVSFQDTRSAVQLMSGNVSWDLVLWSSLGTAALIGGASLWKMTALSSGGRAVAQMMGGVLIHPDTRDPAERRLINVVEEMSLASGTAVPDVYVLDQESGINAFAAGHEPSSSAVAVSRGALDALTREELQGVVAHEFSHIFNGDMRLNIRLIGLLHGILAIAVVGRALMRGRSSSRRGKGGGGAALIGLGLFVVGYVGVFFAQLIKSAISRQREFLADASAVQFTRNPSGILGALLKIRAGTGSRLLNARTEEVSHLLFASGLSSLFTTHPPIEERLRAIDPSLSLADALDVSSRPPAEAVAGFASAAAPAPAGPASTPAAAVAAVGAPTAESLAAAERMMAAFPEALHAQLRTPEGARTVVYALLLSRDADVRARQAALLGEELPAVQALASLADSLDPKLRFPAVQLAAPALRTMPPDAAEAFLSRAHALVVEDNRVDRFELLLELFLRRLFSSPGRRPAVHFRQALPSALTALGFLAHAGHPGRPGDAEASFRRGLEPLGSAVRAALPPSLELGPEAVGHAVEALSAADPETRRKVMEACAACILSDGNVAPEEWETLSVFGAVLDCPLPPSIAAV